MKVVLLDIDGVLNHSGCPLDCPCRKDPRDMREDFLPELVGRLNTITDKTDAQIVVCSTWRVRQTIEELGAILSKAGVTAPVVDKTPWLWDNVFDPEDPERAEEYICVEKRAANWLWTQRYTPEAHPERYPEGYFDRWPSPEPVDAWVILEDDPSALWDDPRCIWVRGKEGLTDDHVGRAIRLLNWGTP